jgi:hypothetical protein
MRMTKSSINQKKRKAHAHRQPLRNLDLIYSIGVDDKEIQIYLLT